MKEFKLPELGEDIESAEVVRVLVSEGDEIEEEQNVLELETEKATIELPCPHGGRIAKIHVGEGDTISVGDLILSLENGEDDASKGKPEEEDREKSDEDGEESAEKRKKTKDQREDEEGQEDDGDGDGEEPERQTKEATSEKAERDAEPDDSKGESDERGGSESDGTEEGDTEPDLVREQRGPAGPGTRRLARQLDVDLKDVRGTGSRGRITREDVETHARRGSSRDGASLPDFERWGPVERLDLSNTMRAVARNVATSWERIPHVTHHDLADITELENLRKRYMEENEPAAKITLTALVLKVAAIALEENRRFNSSFDAGADEIIVKDYIHLGIAVDTERGLVVPVIRDCDRKSVVQLASEVRDLAERGRSGKLKPEEMQGGTFTITNLGGVGGVAFTPIIRYPEVAILGLSRAAWKRVEGDGETEQSGASARRQLLPLSLSYDHRVINGADAARFAMRIADLLAHPTRWLFEG